MRKEKVIVNSYDPSGEWMPEKLKYTTICTDSGEWVEQITEDLQGNILSHYKREVDSLERVAPRDGNTYYVHTEKDEKGRFTLIEELPREGVTIDENAPHPELERMTFEYGENGKVCREVITTKSEKTIIHFSYQGTVVREDAVSIHPTYNAMWTNLSDAAHRSIYRYSDTRHDDKSNYKMYFFKNGWVRLWYRKDGTVDRDEEVQVQVSETVKRTNYYNNGKLTGYAVDYEKHDEQGRVIWWRSRFVDLEAGTDEWNPISEYEYIDD